MAVPLPVEFGAVEEAPADLTSVAARVSTHVLHLIVIATIGINSKDGMKLGWCGGRDFAQAVYNYLEGYRRLGVMNPVSGSVTGS